MKAAAVLLCCVLVPGLRAQSLKLGEAPNAGGKDTGGVHAPTAALERGRTVFVESSCHFCHGVDLTVTSMGAANLMRSSLVGADVHGEIIGAVVKAGLPNLQTSMPSYYEMTPQQITDLAAYVHYLRQQGHFIELTNSPSVEGNAVAGRAYFEGTGGCAGCHTDVRDLGVSKVDLRERILLPAAARQQTEAPPSTGVAAHRKLTENITASQLADVTAYLGQLRSSRP